MPIFAVPTILIVKSAYLIPKGLRLAMIDAPRWLLVPSRAALGVTVTLLGLIKLESSHGFAVAQTEFLAAPANGRSATIG